MANKPLRLATCAFLIRCPQAALEDHAQS
ncbi:hypothetical protein VTO73DRAFT_10953 [Trametes versicolor]